MKIQYWGTAAAEGIPGVYCDCEVCRKAREKQGRCIRTRSQLLINGELLVDFGPDTYMHSLKYGFDMSRLTDVLITHVHSDHFYAQELYFRHSGFSTVLAESTLTVHGSPDLLGEFLQRSEAQSIDVLGDRLAFNVLEPFVSVNIRGYTVTPMPARHGTEHPYVYLIRDGEGKSFLLLNDTGRLLPEVYEWLKENRIKLDLISFDCTYCNCNTYEKYGKAINHMGIVDNFAVRQLLTLNGNVTPETVCVVNHFSHNGQDADYDDMCEVAKDYCFTVSYDGMEIEI